MERFDVIIAGGGLNGLTQSLALLRAGFRVALADAEPQEERSEDVRAYALNVASINLLGALGVWEKIAPFAQEMREVVITDGRVGSGPSPLSLAFDARDTPGGSPGFMVEQRHLRPALLAALHEAGASIKFGARVTSAVAKTGSIEADLQGQTVAASLLIAADGKASSLAQAAGITRTGWSYDQHAIVLTIRHSLPHDGRARQFFTPGGPLALLPLQGNRSCVVWTESTGQAKALLALTRDDLMAAFRPLATDVLGAIEIEAGPVGFPLQLSLANHLVAPRIALIGDAAHVLHPLAGQGLNAGLKDVAALSDVLTKAARRGEDIGRPEVLARYESWRRFDIAQLAVMTDGVNRVFSNDNPLLRGARDLALAAIGQVPALKRLIAKEASGRLGDLPEFL